MDDPEENVQEIAAGLIEYFQRNASPEGREVWVKGAQTAEYWVRLMQSERVSQEDLQTLYGIAHANRYRTSMWMHMAGLIYHWVQEHGLSVPEPREFFGSERRYIRHWDEPLSKYAEYLVSVFELYMREDHGYPTWVLGREVAKEWQHLLNEDQVAREQASDLVQRVNIGYDKYSSALWFDMTLAIHDWCDEIGYLNLVPQDRRQFLKNSDHRED
jgi:hypothetical protein